MAARKIYTFVISGNHDSAERLAVHNTILDKFGLFISGTFDGKFKAVEMEDEYGKIYFHMLPFVNPAVVKSAFSDETIETYTDAVRCAVKHMNVDTTQRNILISHQFVTGSITCDSEEKTVGGLDNVDVSAYDAFDYVALGHLHVAQKTGKETVRYCGSPIKYSFSEMKGEKKVLVVDIKEKGNINIKEIPIKPIRDMGEVKGSFELLTSKDFYSSVETDNYMRVTLTDEEDIPNAKGYLSKIYPNIMELRYDNTRTRAELQEAYAKDVEKKTTQELFSDLYEIQNGAKMSTEQENYVIKLIEKIEEDNR